MAFVRAIREEDFSERYGDTGCAAESCHRTARWVATRSGDALCNFHAREEERRHVRDLDARVGSVSV